MLCYEYVLFFFFFQAEDGIRDSSVTGVQTCALPIYLMITDFESIHYRHGEICDHQVWRPVVGNLQRGLSVVGYAQIVAMGIERGPQHTGDLRLVVNHEDAPVIGRSHLASWVTICTSIGGAWRRNF